MTVTALTRPLDQAIAQRIKDHPPTLKIGDEFPDVTLTRYKDDASLEASLCWTRENFSTLDRAKSVENVFIRTLPGAFTKVCGQEDILDLKEHLPALQKKYDKVVVVTTDRTDVLRGWLKMIGIYPQVEAWADNEGKLTDAIGQGINMSGDRGHDMGIQRGVMILKNGKITQMDFEEIASDHILTKAALFV